MSRDHCVFARYLFYRQNTRNARSTRRRRRRRRTETLLRAYLFVSLRLFFFCVFLKKARDECVGCVCRRSLAERIALKILSCASVFFFRPNKILSFFLAGRTAKKYITCFSIFCSSSSLCPQKLSSQSVWRECVVTSS